MVETRRLKRHRPRAGFIALVLALGIFGCDAGRVQDPAAATISGTPTLRRTAISAGADPLVG